MDDEMRDFAINEATKALETSNSEKVSLRDGNFFQEKTSDSSY